MTSYDAICKNDLTLQITKSEKPEKFHNEDIIINVKASRQIMDTFIITKDYEASLNKKNVKTSHNLSEKNIIRLPIKGKSCLMIQERLKC